MGSPQAINALDRAWTLRCFGTDAYVGLGADFVAKVI